MNFLQMLNPFKQTEHENYQLSIFDGGYIYCIIPMKYDIKTNLTRDNTLSQNGRFVIKVGMSSFEKIETRLKCYGQGTVVLAKLFCMNTGTMEKIILNEFRKKFDAFVGAEYFIAKPDEAVNLFLSIFKANTTDAIGNIKIPKDIQQPKQKQKRRSLNSELIVKKNPPNPLVQQIPIKPTEQKIPIKPVEQKIPIKPVEQKKPVEFRPLNENDDILVNVIEKQTSNRQSLLEKGKEILSYLWGINPHENTHENPYEVNAVVESKGKYVPFSDESVSEQSEELDDLCEKINQLNLENDRKPKSDKPHKE